MPVLLVWPQKIFLERTHRLPIFGSLDVIGATNSFLAEMWETSQSWGHDTWGVLFSYGKRGHFLDTKGHFFVYCKILGARHLGGAFFLRKKGAFS